MLTLQSLSKPINRRLGDQKRFLNKCLHIKGLPMMLSKEEIYAFMKNYGSIDQIASYQEAAVDNELQSKAKRKNHISHNRLPGQTAIVSFRDTASAIRCREDLHWRPFPHASYTLNREIIQKNPRDRPLVNILFDTETLTKRLRGWVARDLKLSERWIQEIEKKEYKGKFS
jgi:hypothetical protein